MKKKTCTKIMKKNGFYENENVKKNKIKNINNMKGNFSVNYV